MKHELIHYRESLKDDWKKMKGFKFDNNKEYQFKIQANGITIMTEMSTYKREGWCILEIQLLFWRLLKISGRARWSSRDEYETWINTLQREFKKCQHIK